MSGRQKSKSKLLGKRHFRKSKIRPDVITRRKGLYSGARNADKGITIWKGLDSGERNADKAEWDHFTKAMQEGKENDLSSRIHVVGNISQGKTTLIRRLVGHSIDGVETTNGFDIEKYICKQSENGNLYCTKHDNDSSNKLGRYCMVAKSKELKEAEMEKLTSDVYDSKSLNSDKSTVLVKTEKKDFWSFSSYMKKGHEGNPVIAEEDVLTFNIWDFGGQYVYYATHTMFHTSNAIYLLVMNLSLAPEDVLAEDVFPKETDDRNIEYYIKFWIRSILLFVGTPDGSDPLIILVGTHKDKLHGDENSKQRHIRRYFEYVRKLFDMTDVINHIHPKDFAVNSTSSADPEIESLRKEIVELGKAKASTVQIPTKWIPLGEALFKRRNENIISLDEVKKIDADNVYPVGKDEHIKLFLKYHHLKGNLFYFDEEPVSEYVLINPQYLIDAFKCIFTSEKFCTNDPKIRPLWLQLVNDGRLESKLIDILWQMNEDKQFMAHRNLLLSFLQKHHTIVEVITFNEIHHLVEGQGWYIVPSLLKNRIPSKKIRDFLTEKKQTAIQIALLFKNSVLLPVIGHRLFAAALGKWNVASFHNHLLLFENYVVLRLDKYQAGIINMNLKENAIELQVVGLGYSPCLGDTFRQFIEMFVKHELKNVETFEPMEPYRLCYRCSDESHNINGSWFAELLQMEGRHVPCPDWGSHSISVIDAKLEWFHEDKLDTNEIKQLIPSEKQLRLISMFIGKNWEILGLALGLTEVELDHITEDNHKASMKRVAMLMEWRRQQADRATIDVLLDTFRSVPQVRIDWDNVRKLINDMKQEVWSTHV